MAHYQVPDYEPTDDYGGLFQVKKNERKFVDADTHKMVSMKKLKLPNVGEIGVFRIKASRKKFKKFEGEVIGKYGEDHILVKNLKNGFKESFFKRDFLTKEVSYKPLQAHAS
jgi:hypothetical protein